MIISDLTIKPMLEGAKISFIAKDLSAVNNLINIADKETLTAKIEPLRQKRSTNANSYMWVLCEKIAQVIHSTKEEVYRKAIREVGVFNDVAVQSKAVAQLIETWTSRGIGWIVDTFDSKIANCKRVRLYTGSHLYNTKEMARLIDYIVEEAKELGIETLTQDELKQLIERE